ncbi:MAG: glutathione S-transferase N-terminal domain-containing protein [Pseudomonadota bacterium]
MVYAINWLLSTLSSVLRLGAGLRAHAAGGQPAERLIIYEFEGCPYCRKVREAVTALDLEVEIRPCPKGGKRFRPELIERGGRAQFPYLIDPNAEEEMYESNAIIRHLFSRYGSGAPPLLLRLGPLSNMLSSLAQLPRMGAGTYAATGLAGAAPAAAPLPLLVAAEGSPSARLVRERLSVLEQAYVLQPCGVGSRHASTAGRTALQLAGEARLLGAAQILRRLQ